MDNLLGLRIILLGGDRREVELYRCWKGAGLRVKMAGFEDCLEVEEEDQVALDYIEMADVLIAPLSGIKANGSVSAAFSSKQPFLVRPYIEAAGSRAILLAGSIAPALSSELSSLIDIYITAEDSELALLNAVPTAEGAIQKAMELSDITLHDSNCLIIGLGRCGLVLARTLTGLGARVSVVLRRRETEAAARIFGMKVYYGERLAEALLEADFIFNTAPTLILDSSALESAKSDAVILDLASAPGGTDFQAAQKRGLIALLLPGLPGKVAPRTAGQILSDVYPKIIKENVSY